LNDSGKKIELKGYDDIFASDAATISDEQVRQIPLDQLFPFKDHPFKVLDDQSMQDTVDSIKEYGVLVPAIVRPRAEGGYELVSGHRRKHASELAGLKTMPVIVRNLDDDAATILMVDSNLQRENILPSERAFAFKMKLEAIKHQGNRDNSTCGQLGHKLDTQKSRDIIAEQTGESGRQVQRYIRLTNLIPGLLDMVDQGTVAMNPAVFISFLKPEEQEMLLKQIDICQATPSVSQAQRLKSFSQCGKLSENVIMAILSEEKKNMDKVTISGETINKYFPSNYTPRQKEETIISLLDQWQKKRERKREYDH
jgi:ParB family chromosome partitioning protein